jgi:hypothetical protein
VTGSTFRRTAQIFQECDGVFRDFSQNVDVLKGANAAAELLLPIAAVAVGMTVLGLVFHIIASGAA